MTDGQDQSSDSDPRNRDAILLLYEIGTRNIEFAKLQQWRVIYYVSLVYAAFIYLHHDHKITDFGCDFFWCNFYWLTILVAVTGAIVLVTLEVWLYEERRRNDNVVDEISKKSPTFKQLVKGKSQCIRNFSNRFVSALFFAIVIAGAWITTSAVAS